MFVFHYCCVVLLLLLSRVSGGDPPSMQTYTSRHLLPEPLELILLNDHNGNCTVTSFSTTQQHRLLSTFNDVAVVSRPQTVGLDIPKTQGALERVQLIGHSSAILWKKAVSICPNLASEEVPKNHANQHAFSWPHYNEVAPGLEIYPLEVSGPSTNRVDLAFFSDGYTQGEKDKFLADAKRLASDMSRNQTFSTVRPLMNFWAVYVPSLESGIGEGGTPKDTAFGLYRDGTELRAVYCSKPETARAACLGLRSQCDYPILLGNDPLYGGLGGEFTISTASEINGPLVLRHELGHSIIGVGEEYDGGFAYFGVNAAQKISQGSPFPWSHWLSPSALTSSGLPRKERAVMDFQAYPWTLLNKTSPWSATFTSSGLYNRSVVRFSLSGFPGKDDLKVQLDGKDLGWKPRPDIKLDRWHYDINHTKNLTSGLHNISFTLGKSAIEGKAQLCSAEIIEYGDENEFNSTVGYYGAFPTFSDKNETTFRPTNEQCLMRIVTSSNFCKVCLEGLWMSLLKRVSLIDSFTITTSGPGSPGVTVFDLALVPFGQVAGFNELRPVGEAYTIVWKRDDVEIPAFANQTKITVDGTGGGIWRVDLQLHTPEVRADPNGLLKQWAMVIIENNQEPEFTIGH